MATRSRSGGANGGTRRAAAKKRKPPATLLDCRYLRSPAPEQPGSAGRLAGALAAKTGDTGAMPAPSSAPRPAWDEARVVQLAAAGLTADEVLAELGWTAPLGAEELLELETIIRRGRVLGAAALKQAQYQAALEGRVSAQSQLLSLLGAAPAEPAPVADPARDPVTVTRHILDESGHDGD